MRAIYNFLPIRFISISFMFVILFSVSSCEDDSEEIFQYADLEVYVSGTLSGNPRSGLRVAIYDTEEDAINEVNAVTYSQTTDSEGFALFQSLEPGFRYWIRVDTSLIHNINRSQVLAIGFNEMSMTIL